MNELVKLNYQDHGALKIAPNCTTTVAQNQHVIGLRVNEIGQATTSFPVFVSRIGDTDDWTLSAMASFEAGTNLFVKDDRWHATHVPSSMQSYPFFLMKSEEDENGYTAGIIPTDKAFSEKEGEPIFKEDGEQTDLVKNMIQVLKDDIKHSAQTRNFTRALVELDLLKPTNLLVNYADSKEIKITGLTTIDEDKLRSLDADKFLQLRENGYLIAIYAILLSPYQLKGLINLHNQQANRQVITQVKMDFDVQTES